MADSEMRDAEVLAFLTDDERFLWKFVVIDSMQRETLRRLAAERRTVRELRAALSGRTMYDAAAVEREACAGIFDDESASYQARWLREPDGSTKDYLGVEADRAADVAARIRARGVAGGAHGN